MTTKTYSAMPAIIVAAMTLAGCLQGAPDAEEGYAADTLAEDDVLDDTEVVVGEWHERMVFDERRPHEPAVAIEMVEPERYAPAEDETLYPGERFDSEPMDPADYEPRYPIETIDPEPMAPDAYEPSYPIETIEPDQLDPSTYEPKMNHGRLGPVDLPICAPDDSGVCAIESGGACWKTRKPLSQGSHGEIRCLSCCSPQMRGSFRCWQTCGL